MCRKVRFGRPERTFCRPTTMWRPSCRTFATTWMQWRQSTTQSTMLSWAGTWPSWRESAIWPGCPSTLSQSSPASSSCPKSPSSSFPCPANSNSPKRGIPFPWQTQSRTHSTHPPTSPLASSPRTMKLYAYPSSPPKTTPTTNMAKWRMTFAGRQIESNKWRGPNISMSMKSSNQVRGRRRE